jgi:hypothetical protein
MWIAVAALAAFFGLLLFGRLAGAQRALLARTWPAWVLGGGAVFLLLRGQIAFAAGLLLLAGGFYYFTRREPAAARPAPSGGAMGVAEARMLLGVRAGATAQEIRAAHRAKIAQAHPDRGGSTDEAARLNAARDLLLRVSGRD